MDNRIWRISLLAAVLAGAVALALAGAVATGQEEEADPAADALAAAVERGRALFHDEKFGTNGKACANCHENPDKPTLHLADRAGDYPKYDKRERRVITLGQKINQMIHRMVKGEALELGSEKLVDIQAYIMKLVRER